MFSKQAITTNNLIEETQQSINLNKYQALNYTSLQLFSPIFISHRCYDCYRPINFVNNKNHKIDYLRDI